MQNPYASHLGGRDPLVVIAKTPAELGRLVSAIGSRVDEPRAPGKWSPRQILTHLADCEIAFAFRLRQALAEERHTVQPFNQDRWADHYAAYDAPAALDTFAALRRWNVALIRSLPSAAMDRVLVHPERGEMRFRVLVETMGGHDLNHLAQLEEVAAFTPASRPPGAAR
jgi:hypothetical protein